jgi:hypothetical protein
MELSMLSSSSLPPGNGSRGEERSKGVLPMPEFSLMWFLLIPFALGESFLLWALWQLLKQTRR